MFSYRRNSTIIFGAESQNTLENLLREHHATSVLFVYSGDYVFNLGISDNVRTATAHIGASLIEDGATVPNPRIEHVRELITLAREHHVDFVLAAGGGSSFDTAKAVAVGVGYSGDVWELFTGAGTFDHALPVGVIATLAGSGSEVSDCAVLQEGLDKRSLEDDRIIPVFTIVNPEYSATAPYHHQASAIADLAADYFEPYFCTTAQIHAQDRLLEAGLRAVIHYGRRYAANPNDYQTRAELHWLSSEGFNDCYLAAGRVTDWTTHRLEHALGAQFDIIHGEGIAVLAPAVIRYVSQYQPERYAALARAVFDVPEDATDIEAAHVLADGLAAYFAQLGMTQRLRDLDIPQSSLPDIAARITDHGRTRIGNYYPLSQEDVLAVYQLAY
ncbi:iron-containing alcohol dehydrogenase [Bifidobacterium goeldii]|uniref:Iron-containing alcohol dehydrogenase n=1 Tax=Bifidobacterium goeldii TaxID=2306975 RepID=A0A430FKY0_9BIFI|nr:iron-containing alcohol dehydrogenase [Bifidobacterium goeldii]RSX53549.1 iron-containing alcohol dehydrogenase [Bifidobacterium goeldii]